MTISQGVRNVTRIVLEHFRDNPRVMNAARESGGASASSVLDAASELGELDTDTVFSLIADAVWRPSAAVNEHAPRLREADPQTLTFKGRAPVYATPGSAGCDLAAGESVWLTPGITRKVPTGTYVAIPEGSAGLLFVRSSVGSRGIGIANGVGVIDSDYRGEVGLLLVNRGEAPKFIEEGERIAQLVIVPAPQMRVVQVDELPPTDRGAGGFGSTGR